MPGLAAEKPVPSYLWKNTAYAQTLYKSERISSSLSPFRSIYCLVSIGKLIGGKEEERERER